MGSGSVSSLEGFPGVGAQHPTSAAGAVPAAYTVGEPGTSYPRATSSAGRSRAPSDNSLTASQAGGSRRSSLSLAADAQVLTRTSESMIEVDHGQSTMWAVAAVSCFHGASLENVTDSALPAFGKGVGQPQGTDSTDTSVTSFESVSIEGTADDANPGCFRATLKMLLCPFRALFNGLCGCWAVLACCCCVPVACWIKTWDSDTTAHLQEGMHKLQEDIYRLHSGHL